MSEEPDHNPALGRHELQDSAIRGASWTLIHTLISVPLAFGVNIVLARVLGKVDYGRLAFLSTLMDVVGGFVSMGLGIGLVQFGAKAHALGQRDSVRSLLSKSQGFRLLVEAPILTVVIIALAHVDTPLLIIAIVFGVIAPSALSGAPACLTIENKTAAGAQNAMIANLLTQAAVLAVVLTLRTSDSVWAVRLITTGAGVALAMIWVSSDYRRAVLHPTLPKDFPAGFWRFSIPAGLAAVLGTLVVSRTEVLALEWLHKPAEAGLFALAFGLAGHLFAPAQALIGPLVPAISGLREVDEGAIRPAFNRTIRATSTVISLISASVLPSFALLIPLIYGQDYVAAPPLFMVLGLGGAFLVLTGPVSAFVQSRLTGWPLLKANLVSLVVDVVLVIALIPSLGVWGAVIANITAAMTRLILLSVPELRSLGLTPRDLAKSLLPLAIGAIASIVAWMITCRLPINTIVAAILAAFIGLGLLLASLALTHTGLTDQDAAAILGPFPSALKPTGSVLLKLVSHAPAD